MDNASARAFKTAMPDLPAPPAPTILIVEDEAIIAADLVQRLERLGYDIVGPAASAEEAMALARAGTPDLALLDIRLQGATDGIALAASLRGELQVPVIFLTAHADAATLERAQAAESYGYLLKPFDERLLQITIDMALHRHALEQERMRLTAELERALAEVKTLTGLLPICAECKKIEDADGRWNPIESYISKRTDANFTHSICPHCVRKLYPEMADKLLDKTKADADRRPNRMPS